LLNKIVIKIFKRKFLKKWNRVRRLGDTYYENELIERSITEKIFKWKRNISKRING